MYYTVLKYVNEIKFFVNVIKKQYSIISWH